MFNKTISVAVISLLVIFSKRGAAKPLVKFIATPSAKQYKYHEALFRDGTIKFQAHLINVSNELIALSNDPVYVSVEKITKNGVSLFKHIHVADIYGALQEEGEPLPVLAAVKPRSQVTFKIPNLVDIGYGKSQVIDYSCSGPGIYTVQFNYRYTGPDENMSNVFRETVLSEEVSFAVK